MPDPRRSGRRGPPLQRSDLAAAFTSETMRELDLATLRRLSQRSNRILNADEQRDFDGAGRGVLLERIASIEQQQLEHHRSQALRDVRGVYFAVVVSVAVIVAGVAPLVEADGGDRFLILVWTAGLCLTAGLVYAVVRSTQSHRVDPD